MSDFLGSLAGRSLGLGAALTPRRASSFEKAPAALDVPATSEAMPSAQLAPAAPAASPPAEVPAARALLEPAPVSLYDRLPEPRPSSPAAAPPLVRARVAHGHLPDSKPADEHERESVPVLVMPAHVPARPLAPESAPPQPLSVPIITHIESAPRARPASDATQPAPRAELPSTPLPLLHAAAPELAITPVLTPVIPGATRSVTAEATTGASQPTATIEDRRTRADTDGDGSDVTVQVTIGRIEVRATAPAAAPVSRERKPRLSLDNYLNRRKAP